MRTLLLKQLGELASHSSMGPLQRLKALWGVLVGRKLAGLSRPERIDGGSLVVGVANPTVAQELQMQSQEILAGLARHQDIFQIRNLGQLVTRVLPSRAFASRRPKSSESVMPKPTKPLSGRIRDALEDVADDDLRARLSRLSRTNSD